MSSIVFGGNLSFVYRLHTSSYDDRVSVDTSLKASGSYLSFTGSGNSAFSTNVNSLIKSSRMAVEFYQSGGKSTPVPVSVDDMAAIFKGFAASVADSPKPLYVILTSYSRLPNWNNTDPSERPSLSELYTRLYARLSFIIHTVDDIKDDRWRDLKKDPLPFYITYDENGRIRQEDIDGIRDAVLKRMAEVRRVLSALNDPKCSTRHTCPERGNVHSSDELDDYAYRILLPLPRNAVPPEFVSVLAVGSPYSLEQKQFIYSNLLYRFWVERTAEDRCQVLGDCRTTSELKRYSALATSSVRSLGTQSAGTGSQLALLRAYLPNSYTVAKVSEPRDSASPGSVTAPATAQTEEQIDPFSSDTSPQADYLRRLFACYQMNIGGGLQAPKVDEACPAQLPTH